MTATTAAPKVETFKKGQLVTLFGDWDRKGTCWFSHAVVYSCGKKQMVLTHAETGLELGRHFAPAAVQSQIVPRMNDEQSAAYALQLGAEFSAKERAHINRCLAHPSNADSVGYLSAMRRELALLHEPSALKR